MYDLSNICYCCLTHTANLTNINVSSSTNVELARAVAWFGLNVYWSNRTLSICEKCSLQLRAASDFVSMCHKNNSTVRGYVNALNDEQQSNGGEAQLVLRLESIPGRSCKIKLEHHRESAGHEDIEKYSRNIPVNVPVTAATEKQCPIKPEIKIEIDSGQTLVNQCHSELDIKEEFACYRGESEEGCDADTSVDTLVNDCKQRNVVNEAKGNGCGSVRIKKSHRCTHCSKFFSRKSFLKNHMRVHTGERPYSCSMCGKDFITKSHLNYHVAHHSGARLFECATCAKRFMHKRNLTQHMRIHTGEKPYKCNTCGKRFDRKSGLDYHVRNHTGEKLFACRVCSKRFILQVSLDNHVRIHTGEKPFRCATCNECFRTKASLNYHVQRHSDVRLFQCLHCDKTFRYKSSLVAHVRIHTGEKPYKCSTCNDCFRTKLHLNHHVRIHSSDKLFECRICNRGFTMKSHLNSHLRVHAGEKSCNRAFTRKSTLGSAAQ